MIQALIYAIPPFVLLGYLAHKFYLNGPMCKSKNRLNSKVVIITGANCGIGYETALDLARRGSKIFFFSTTDACRDLKKAQEAADRIIFETKSQTVLVEVLDLASLKSIKGFADSFRQKYKRLDILINNAGLTGNKHSETEDGFELLFGVMHLGHFYLTNLLLDLLKSSAPSRIINVSSEGHKMGTIKWDDLKFEKNFGSFSAYCNAKLANVLFTVELARRFKEDGITSVSLHPGAVKTDIFRESKNKSGFELISFLIVTTFIWIFGKDCEKGAQTTIHCAVSDEILEQNGKYFKDCKVAKCSLKGMDLDSAKRLWELSSKLVPLE